MYFEKEDLRQAKQMSAIEFLKRYRPEELVRCSTGEYELRSHDSFKISESTSLWHWKSRDIGGKSALDYLVRVEGVPFTGAVQYLLKQEPPGYMPTPKSAGRKPFVLPPAAREEYRVELYLQSRGVSLDVIRVPFPVSWTVKMKKKQKETQDILSYHTQAAGCSDKARAKASGGRQPIEECGRTGL